MRRTRDKRAWGRGRAWLTAGLAAGAMAACQGHDAARAPSVPSPSGHAGEHEHAGEHVHAQSHSPAHGLRHDFSDVERFAAVFDDPARDVWQKPEEVIRHLALEPGDAVADLGTGTGYFLPYLQRAVGAEGVVWALDVEPKMVEHVRRRASEQGLSSVRAKTVAPDDPGLEPASVSRILIVDTWHHVGDRERYAAKLARALRPEGEVWIVDFTLDSDVGPPARHRLAPERVRDELEAGGLSASIVEGETLPNQYLVRGVLRR